jgi:hypothetical protein
MTSAGLSTRKYRGGSIFLRGDCGCGGGRGKGVASFAREKIWGFLRVGGVANDIIVFFWVARTSGANERFLRFSYSRGGKLDVKWCFSMHSPALLSGIDKFEWYEKKGLA